MSRSVVLRVRESVQQRCLGGMEFSLTFTLQTPSGFMSLLLITHFVERAANAEPGLGTSAIATFLGGGLSMASEREGPCRER